MLVLPEYEYQLSLRHAHASPTVEVNARFHRIFRLNLNPASHPPPLRCLTRRCLFPWSHLGPPAIETLSPK
jgi:hypothetical protein